MFVETESRPAGEPAKVGTLKLSEAIRIGARMRPHQCRMAFFEQTDGVRASCALGAAWEAWHGNENCPASNDKGANEAWGLPLGIFEQIPVRNDRGESREQIADWLEQRGL